MRGLNKTMLIGVVGKDPTFHQTASSTTAYFSLATNEEWIDKKTGEKKGSTEWHNITVFGGLAEVVQSYVKKGSVLYIEGKNSTRKQQDSNGVEQYKTSVIVDSFNGSLLLMPSSNGGHERGSQQPHTKTLNQGLQPADQSNNLSNMSKAEHFPADYDWDNDDLQGRF